jgi:hypothetical protein
MPAYLILTSKPGQFRTELGDNLRPIEAYDYVAHGRKRARFVIAEVTHEAKIAVVDEGTPPVVNNVPSKFFPRFDSIEKARSELGQLAGTGSANRTLVRI